MRRTAGSWSGERDLAVPAAHGHWLADHIPAIDAHLGETDDHAISIDHECEPYEFLNRHR
jgi:hypothetical protein